MRQRLRLDGNLRRFAIPIIIAAAAVGLAAAAIPQIGLVRSDRQRLDKAVVAAAGLEAKIAALEAIDAKVQADNLETAVAAVPLVEPYRRALALAEFLPLRYDLRASQLKVDTGRQVLSLTLTIFGSMGNIQKFLEEVERVMPLSSTEMIEAGQWGGEDGYQAKTEIKIYFSSAPATIGRVSDPLPALTVQRLETLKQLAKLEKIALVSATEDSGDFIPAVSLFPQ